MAERSNKYRQEIQQVSFYAFEEFEGPFLTTFCLHDHIQLVLWISSFKLSLLVIVSCNFLKILFHCQLQVFCHVYFSILSETIMSRPSNPTLSVMLSAPPDYEEDDFEEELRSFAGARLSNLTSEDIYESERPSLVLNDDVDEEHKWFILDNL